MCNGQSACLPSPVCAMVSLPVCCVQWSVCLYAVCSGQSACMLCAVVSLPVCCVQWSVCLYAVSTRPDHTRLQLVSGRQKVVEMIQTGNDIVHGGLDLVERRSHFCHSLELLHVLLVFLLLVAKPTLLQLQAMTDLKHTHRDCHTLYGHNTHYIL